MQLFTKYTGFYTESFSFQWFQPIRWGSLLLRYTLLKWQQQILLLVLVMVSVCNNSNAMQCSLFCFVQFSRVSFLVVVVI